QVAILFAGRKDGPRADMLMYLPASATSKPVPLFLCLSFTANHKVIADPGIKLGAEWDRNKKTRIQGDEKSRGNSNQWQVEKVLARGYGLAIINYADIEPD